MANGWMAEWLNKVKMSLEHQDERSTGQEGQSFVEYALMLILIAIVVLAIFLIMGDDIRIFVNDLLQAWFPG